jgi:hypothetical protein
LLLLLLTLLTQLLFFCPALLPKGLALFAAGLGLLHGFGAVGRGVLDTLTFALLDLVLGVLGVTLTIAHLLRLLRLGQGGATQA